MTVYIYRPKRGSPSAAEMHTVTVYCGWAGGRGRMTAWQLRHQRGEAMPAEERDAAADGRGFEAD